MNEEWSQLSPDQKLQERFKLWLSPPGVEFAGPEAKQAYRTRAQRFIDVIQLREPDRVPVSLSLGLFPAFYAGLTAEQTMYDPEQLVQACRRFVQDFDLDANPGLGGGPGRAFEVLDCKLYKWPGHGAPPRTSYQYVEAEYMKADEYDALIQDPSDFWLRTYLPRVYGALAPLQKLAPLPDVIELPMTPPNIARYGMPDVQAALKALMEAGTEAAKWLGIAGRFGKEMTEAGLPRVVAGLLKAPFDTLADTLRGTRGMISDMYRQPDKVLEAMERLVPLEVKRGISAANVAGVPEVMFVLHKGADGFMSERQFETFYWAPLKKVVLGLIEEGVVPAFFAEGGYNSRLDVVKDLPRGKVVWLFDKTDMARAKAVLGGSACIMGNVPASLLWSGTPAEVRDYCKKTIETAGKGGGFVLAPGAVIEQARPENIHALIDSAKEYGTYQRA